MSSKCKRKNAKQAIDDIAQSTQLSDAILPAIKERGPASPEVLKPRRSLEGFNKAGARMELTQKNSAFLFDKLNQARRAPEPELASLPKSSMEKKTKPLE